MAVDTRAKTQRCTKCYKRGWFTSSSKNQSSAELCDCVQNCISCNGIGYDRVKNESGYDFLIPCPSCGDIRRKVKRYNLAGIPAKFKDVLEVGSFHPRGRGSIEKSQQRALAYVGEFVKNYPNKRGFMLMGGAGVGKTHLAIGAISEMTLIGGVRCIFKDFFYLLSDLKDAYSHGHSENEVIEPLIETEVLVIDELAKGKSSDWELNILDQLISKRYNASKITIATTNYLSADCGDRARGEVLDDRVGERIASRLHEMCEFLLLEGEDFRQSKNK
ncbi:MAG: ATP-binding protein [Thermodesulfobacteriota bacterium]